MGNVVQLPNEVQIVAASLAEMARASLDAAHQMMHAAADLRYAVEMNNLERRRSAR
jgi:hypothetical protein